MGDLFLALQLSVSDPHRNDKLRLHYARQNCFSRAMHDGPGTQMVDWQVVELVEVKNV